jgi:hypothetical protein
MGGACGTGCGCSRSVSRGHMTRTAIFKYYNNSNKEQRQSAGGRRPGRWKGSRDGEGVSVWGRVDSGGETRRSSLQEYEAEGFKECCERGGGLGSVKFNDNSVKFNDQRASVHRGLLSKGDARALHHQPAPALTFTVPCLSCS